MFKRKRETDDLDETKVFNLDEEPREYKANEEDYLDTSDTQKEFPKYHSDYFDTYPKNDKSENDNIVTREEYFNEEIPQQRTRYNARVDRFLNNGIIIVGVLLIAVLLIAFLV